MGIAQMLLPEFEHEMAGTRKTLERVPQSLFDWRAHPKSNTVGWVCAHLVEIPGWVEGTMTMDSWDIHPVGGEPYKTEMFTEPNGMLERFDANVAAAKKALSAGTDPAFGQPWSLMMQGKPIVTMPRLGVIRTFVLNHTIHHRAHLCVYLRLNDIAVPALYGPSADEEG